MILLQTVVRVAPPVYRHFVQLRGVTKTTNVVSTPPSVKISFAEKNSPWSLDCIWCLQLSCMGFNTLERLPRALIIRDENHSTAYVMNHNSWFCNVTHEHVV